MNLRKNKGMGERPGLEQEEDRTGKDALIRLYKKTSTARSTRVRDINRKSIDERVDLH